MTKRVAVVQAASALFDTPASVGRAVSLIREAAGNGAQLVVFPEAFLGGYPKGAGLDSYVGRRTPQGRELFRRYFESAVELNGAELREVGEAAREGQTTVVIGVIERLGNTLYCTAVTIGPSGRILNIHRKLMPTGSERLIWGFGDGSTIDVVDTPVGRVGAVICWENYMPLLRCAMYAQQIELYCAPTVDDRPTWLPTMTHIALEGRVHVLSACQILRKRDIPVELEPELPQEQELALRGGSAIISPLGELLAGPLFDEEGILYAEIDLADQTRAHLDMDVVGHYGRPDVFQLRVDRQPKSPVTWLDNPVPLAGQWDVPTAKAPD
ncbi:carbon-nitrogen hydrolase family protein [Arthrobacter sp. zg-Y750]|uniref:carbon-nitrogen hydrolase family protein n=1 Tax=Arthrobacter sp. zg-Y750 TaxID=2894189 RepID=UPI001E335300|nr:carbon-nitrogen hydrolase family protein [Arthrobacter sp. zg-Y750]MCC9178333.1 carbon-nitrogen hydrolase family protein [Arthrobacter sp. zg-Y750]